jgi:hypothetical protein
VRGSSTPCATLTFGNSCSSRLRRKTDRISEECSRKHSAPLVIGHALRTGMKPMAGERNVGASQPSARPCSATGSVVRAAVCIACGLWSLTSPALAQPPAPTPELQSKPIQPWQGGKPVEFRQPCPVALDKAIPGSLAFAKPANEGVGQEAPGNVEERVLLPLLLEEKRLLESYGPRHPKVLSVRERIEVVREYLAQHPPAPPPTILAAPPPIPVQTPYREAPSTTTGTSSSPVQTVPLPLPPIRSQSLEPGGTESSTKAKDRSDNTQTATSRSRPELIRPVGFSSAGNPIRDSASLAAPPPTVVKTKDKDTQPAAIASTNTSAQAVVSPPSGVRDNSASQPSQEQPRGNSFFETGFGQLIGIVGAVFLGVLIHLIALTLILRRYGTHLARVLRVELVNPAAVGFVGQVSAAGAQTVAAGPATKEVTQSSTAETFDIGPTYAEEMQQKQEALRQQEEAVLRHIFELNVQMREQLGQLSGDAA